MTLEEIKLEAIREAVKNNAKNHSTTTKELIEQARAIATFIAGKNFPVVKLIESDQ